MLEPGGEPVALEFGNRVCFRSPFVFCSKIREENDLYSLEDVAGFASEVAKPSGGEPYFIREEHTGYDGGLFSLNDHYSFCPWCEQVGAEERLAEFEIVKRR